MHPYTQDVFKWLNAVCTFLWYVQLATISRLVGTGDKARIGAYIVLSTAVSLACGLAMMALGMSVASPLLEVFAPQNSTTHAAHEVADTRTVVRDMGTVPLRIMAVSFPATIFQFAGSGVLMGFHRCVCVKCECVRGREGGREGGCVCARARRTHTAGC